MSGGFGMTVLRQHLVQGGGNDATGTQEFHFELGFPAAVALCFSIEAREYEDPSTMSARDEIRSWYGVILSRAWVASHSVVKLHSPEKAELHSTQRATQPSGRSFAEGLLPLQLHVAPVQRLLVVDEENRNTRR